MMARDADLGGPFVITGLSGAGKTSLIQAALIPELEAEHFAVLPVLRVGVKPSSSEGAPDLPTAELARLDEVSRG